MELLTVEEVADLLKLEPQTIRRWLTAGKLNGVKISETAWRVEKLEIDKFIESAKETR